MDKTQDEITQWEKENQSSIVKWVKDFEDNTIQYCFDEKCVNSVTFKIIPITTTYLKTKKYFINNLNSNYYGQ